MSDLLIFAGTTEGRQLAQFVEEAGEPCHVCVATAYGELLLNPEETKNHVHTGRLTAGQMQELMQQEGIKTVVDATHPYAAIVSENIEKAAAQAGARYLRLLREASDTEYVPGEANADVTSASSANANADATSASPVNAYAVAPDGSVWVNSVDEAIAYLEHTEGKILATTGSKELMKYTALTDYKERVYARVLSTLESAKLADAAGFTGSHLICMQGPFTEELNIAMLKSTGAAFLVTKESGKVGGYPEKKRAAQAAGATLVVIGRPKQNAAAKTFEEVKADLTAQMGSESRTDKNRNMHDADHTNASGMDQETNAGESMSTNHSNNANQNTQSSAQRDNQAQEFTLTDVDVTLVGIGMGNAMNMTREAWKACEEADVLIGAQRMLESAGELQKTKVVEYRSENICRYLGEHPQVKKAAVLLSGDVGFYSGAKKLAEALKAAGAGVRMIAGISSVQYLCAKAGTSWDDVKLMSIHGRKQNLVAGVRKNKKVFTLLGKQDDFQKMCRELVDFELGDVHLTVGAALSYPEEKLYTGTAQEMMDAPVGDLTAVLIENGAPDQVITHGIDDERFIRDKVPMTKSEVRSASLSRLELAKDSIVYDVGAGTGSVSIEMALQAEDGFVYAIEKKAEAVELIKKNAKHFHVSNLEVVEGLAPEAMEDLPAPTHAFIGGSSGNLKEIVELLLKKNPTMRIVINAIALETVAEALNVLKEFPVTDVDIASISVGKSKQVARYHMMMGQNPVYVIAFTGSEG